MNPMKKLKTWLLIIGLAGPSVVNLSCLSSVTRELQTAVIAGAATTVQAGTTSLLSNLLGVTVAPTG